MIVQGLGRAPTIVGRPARRVGSGSGFQVAEDAAAEAATAAAPVAMPSLLAMQEAESAILRDRDARRHGEAVMQELGLLQQSLLGGAADLGRLASLAGRTPEAADPGLSAILRAIQVRARIELFRHTPAASR